MTLQIRATPSWFPTSVTYSPVDGTLLYSILTKCDAYGERCRNECKLPLAPARVLSITSHADAKSLHALWPIRAPTFHLRQSERQIPAEPIRTRELSSRQSGQRRILSTSRINTLHIFSNISFRPHLLSLASVPFSLWDRQRVTSDASLQCCVECVTTLSSLAGRGVRTSVPPPPASCCEANDMFWLIEYI